MKKPADHDQRERIRTRLDVSIMVEAAAGTGKTTSLVDRMVRTVETGRARPETLAAITFTVKAAAELRERFQLALEKRGEGEGAARVGFIGTTHAFCARLLRERPVEAGLDPEFQELDEVAARVLATDFWSRWFDAHEMPGAYEAGLDRKTLLKVFERLVEHSDVEVMTEPVDPPELGALCRRVMALIDEAARHMPQPADPKDKFQTLIIKLRRIRDSRDLDGDLHAQLDFIGEANHASIEPTLKRWPDGKLARSIGDRYAQLVKDELRPELRRWQEHVHDVAVRCVRPAVAAFEAERRRDGTLTFQDLLVCARDLLRDHPIVRRYYQGRFTHLFVDEFQDTDPLQAEMMLYLTGSDVEQRDWRQLRPRPGSLFIVGDPKQSIYRFRRADIATYLTVRARMDEVVELRTNFRSGPAICAFVNEAFSRLFDPADVAEKRQAAHIDLVAGGEEGPGVYALETDDGTTTEVVERESAAVARWIRTAVDEGRCTYRDVLLVAWFRARLPAYTKALESAGIPYEITGSRAFGAGAELQLAMPLLEAVAEPDDQVSVAAFLRGPLCGASDVALYRYVRAGGRFNPFAPLADGVDERVAHGLRLIREGIDEVRALPPAAAIARILTSAGVLPLAASGDRPGTRTGTLLLALSIAREESARGSTFQSIVGQLGEMLAAPPDGIEELDADPKRHDAVRIMNLHQVKGLEAPIVFLIDPSDARPREPDLHVDRSGIESQGYFRFTRPFGKGERTIGVPPRWEEWASRESAYRAAEDRRLLYVAATRAQRMLVVGLRKTEKGIRGVWKDLAERVRERLSVTTRDDDVAITAATLIEGHEQANAAMKASFVRARESSYSVLPITKIAHDDHQELVRAEEGLGKGTSWGRVLHRLFEAMLRDETLDIRLCAENLLKDEERDPVELEEVMQVVSAVRTSSLWQRARAADERYVEVPFALTVPAASVGLEEEKETLLHGTIDLVFREQDRWFIVDYKSDSTAGRLEHLVEHYRPQVEHYARFWSQITRSPASGGLFFVDGCHERWVIETA